MLLSGVAADTPANRKLSLWLSHNAYRGCGWCWLQSVREQGDSANWWRGYLRRAPAGDYYGADRPSTAPPPFFSYAGASQLSDADQRSRAARVPTGGVDPRCVGAHGPSPLVHGIAYLTHDVFLLPVMHACLLGLVKDFLALIFSTGKRGEARPWYRIPTWGRAVMVARAQHLRLTDDFGRPYLDVVNCRGSWVIENYLHFLETFSIYIFSPHATQGELLNDTLRTMWQHLRNAVLAVLRPLVPGQPPRDTAENAAQYAKAELMEYGKLAEQHFGR